jgi:hypothetical protein
LRRVLDSGAADPKKIGSLVDLYTTVSPLTLKKEDRLPAGRHAHSPGGEPCHGLISHAAPPAPRSDSFVRERISYGQILI